MRSKKVLALLIAATMVISSSFTAFADTTEENLEVQGVETVEENISEESTKLVTAADTKSLENAIILFKDSEGYYVESGDLELEYNGSDLKPDIEVRYKENPDEEPSEQPLIDPAYYSTSFTKEGESADLAQIVDAGTYTVTITATGSEYTGSKSTNFSISRRGIYEDDITITINGDFDGTWSDGDPYFKYDGTTKTVSVVVKDGDTVLTNGTDYKITDDVDNEYGISAVGDSEDNSWYYVELNGIGNYEGLETADHRWGIVVPEDADDGSDSSDSDNSGNSSDSSNGGNSNSSTVTQSSNDKIEPVNITTSNGAKISASVNKTPAYTGNKKLRASDFISNFVVDGVSYDAKNVVVKAEGGKTPGSSVKVTVKKIKHAGKDVNKKVKGTVLADVVIRPIAVSEEVSAASDYSKEGQIIVKKKNDGSIKNVKVVLSKKGINSGDSKAKKKKVKGYSYDSSSKKLTFDGTELTGSIVIK
ncbi:hypothetical protein QYZ88_001170 [Lachnospiraceae bacterium C1.1]|nr:hypothetical protein [Lachnospiraceae bacterium C1.1]